MSNDIGKGPSIGDIDHEELAKDLQDDARAIKDIDDAPGKTLGEKINNAVRDVAMMGAMPPQVSISLKAILEEYKHHGVTMADLRALYRKMERLVADHRQEQITQQRLAQMTSLSDLPYDVDSMNKRFSVVMLNASLRIFDHTTRKFAKPADIAQLLQHVPVADPDTDATGLGAYWMAHPERATFDKGIGLFVDKKPPQGVLNIWAGWGVKPTKGNCDVFLKHIKEVICSGSEAQAKYVLDWMAQAVQKPDEPGQTAVVVHGIPGAGKGIVGRALERIFGEGDTGHSYHANTENNVVGKFNAHLLSKCFLFADEVSLTSKVTLGRLKAMVTEKWISVELKGVDAGQLQNHLHIYVSTNKEHAACIEPDDRRFAVFEASSHVAQNAEYFKPLIELVEGPTLGHLLHHLLHRDISTFSPQRDIPQTQARAAQKALSFEPLEDWWYDELKSPRIAIAPRRYFADHEKPMDDNDEALRCVWDSAGFWAEGGSLKRLMAIWWTVNKMQGPTPSTREVFKFLRTISHSERASNGMQLFWFEPLPTARQRFSELTKVPCSDLFDTLI
ncbi:primase-helicase family protein [Shimia sp.]|uniref:primase-helicase family protein n=1 Tax=Shimia sp. TaxID=1954381 RepID=UPI00329783E0